MERHAPAGGEKKDKYIIFATSFFQILSNGPRRVRKYGAKIVKIEVPQKI
jgi:hypothetical protein